MEKGKVVMHVNKERNSTKNATLKTTSFLHVTVWCFAEYQSLVLKLGFIFNSSATQLYTYQNLLN